MIMCDHHACMHARSGDASTAERTCRFMQVRPCRAPSYAPFQQLKVMLVDVSIDG